MKNTILLFTIVLLFSSCSSTKKWNKKATIPLGDITPIGLTFFGENIWIADGDNNRVVEINKDGSIKTSLDDFERPMHIDSDAHTVYVPEYGSDQIIQIKGSQKTPLAMTDSLDAPAGVSVFQEEVAIADFYNHRILYFDGANWIAFGQKGKEKGDFHYPTDVQIMADKIYVADAYNNRVQVFDKKGTPLQIIGAEEKMNAATGIYISDKQIFVTDFENDRVLIYGLDGSLKQTLSEELSKPTDVLMIGEDLYVANYKGKNLMVFGK